MIARIIFLSMGLVVLTVANVHAQSETPDAVDAVHKATQVEEKNTTVEETVEQGKPLKQWRGSMFFAPSVIGKLRQALELYQPQSGETADEKSDFLSDLVADTNVQKQEQVIVVNEPYFYLGSIIYTQQGEWFIWLNGKKIAATRPLDDKRVKIDGLSTTNVRFTWKPDNMPEIRKRWERRQEIDSYSGATQPHISIDNAAGTVSFTLKPNQTFFSKTMQVKEGRINPVERLPKGFVDKSLTNNADEPVAQSNAVETALPAKQEPDILSLVPETPKDASTPAAPVANPDTNRMMQIPPAGNATGTLSIESLPVINPAQPNRPVGRP